VLGKNIEFTTPSFRRHRGYIAVEPGIGNIIHSARKPGRKFRTRAPIPDRRCAASGMTTRW